MEPFKQNKTFISKVKKSIQNGYKKTENVLKDISKKTSPTIKKTVSVSGYLLKNTYKTTKPYIIEGLKGTYTFASTASKRIFRDFPKKRTEMYTNDEPTFSRPTYSQQPFYENSTNEYVGTDYFCIEKFNTSKDYNIIPLKKYIEKKEYNEAFQALQNILYNCMIVIDPSIKSDYRYQYENELNIFYSIDNYAHRYAEALFVIISDLRDLGQNPYFDLEMNLKCGAYAGCMLYNLVSDTISGVQKGPIFYQAYAKKHTVWA